MFIQMKERIQMVNHIPQFTVINTPRFHALPELDGTNSETFIIINFGKKLIFIGGTSYAGEIKKSVFTMLNYFYPQKEVLSMHCSANMGAKGDVALFFGLSGTGKTTLSADPERQLIGDDEHGWSDEGVFNFEGGCYAKVINLSKEAEPEIYECTRRFGTILENVAIDMETRRIDLDDASLTENTRAGYPISHIENAVRSGIGDHPKNIIMLTYDAFGVLPPIAKLSHDQAKYHFLTGYTAKVAGTERGMGGKPESTFSPCFGAPFMVLPPTVYARLLRNKIDKHQVNCWLVNTGLSGGPFGVGERIKIAHTRTMIRAILNNSLNNVPTRLDPIFNLQVPVSCEGIDHKILDPRSTWRNPSDYDKVALDLASKFSKNFEKFAPDVPREVLESGPRVG
jgi:phosphoenolpyruvate carboxykinase (ATP)